MDSQWIRFLGDLNQLNESNQIIRILGKKHSCFLAFFWSDLYFQMDYQAKSNQTDWNETVP